MAATIRLREHVRSVIDTDGAVILDLRRGKYYSLNGVAARIWSELERGRSVVEIEDALNERYGTPVDILHRDIAEFLTELQERELIHAGD